MWSRKRIRTSISTFNKFTRKSVRSCTPSCFQLTTICYTFCALYRRHTMFSKWNSNSNLNLKPAYSFIASYNNFYKYFMECDKSFFDVDCPSRFFNCIAPPQSIQISFFEDAVWSLRVRVFNTSFSFWMSSLGNNMIEWGRRQLLGVCVYRRIFYQWFWVGRLTFSDSGEYRFFYVDNWKTILWKVNSIIRARFRIFSVRYTSQCVKYFSLVCHRHSLPPGKMMAV